MSSKLDYLSKYLDDPSSKKDKKKKKKKKERQETRRGGVLVQDQDANDNTDLVVLDQPHNHDEQDNDDDVDDGPVIVNESVLSATYNDAGVVRTRGQWQNILDDGKNSNNNDKPRSIKALRHDSDDDDDHDDNAAAAQSTTRRQRYDSSDEDHVPSKSRQRRYDSSDDDNDEKEERTTKAIRGHRYDSSSAHVDDDKGTQHEQLKKKAKRRYDSDSSTSKHKEQRSKSRRRYYDSDDSNDDQPNSQREKSRPSKIHSNTGFSRSVKEQRQKQKRRYDSDDEENEKDNKVTGHDSFSTKDQQDNHHAPRMSSGHRAGLQTGQGFAQAEADIQSKRNAQAQEMVDRYGMGETVHRGSSKETAAGKPAPLTAAQQAQLNQGKYQKEKASRERDQLERIQKSEFARRVDDDEVEMLRKQALRDGDPMAQYAPRPSKTSKGSKQREQVESRPVYKGPPAKPNRFGIRPGFRWDGNDRGNGFEDRLLAQRSSQSHRQEEAYRWSSADM